MRNKPRIDIAISNDLNVKLEKQKANKSKLIDFLLSEFFKNNDEIPKEFQK